MNALLAPILLLLWSGLAATMLISFVAAPLMGSASGALAPAARPAGVATALLAGALLYPIAYGLGFAFLREASIVTGALLGAMHAGIFALQCLRVGGRDFVGRNRERVLMRVLYGALIGFIYVTP